MGAAFAIMASPKPISLRAWSKLCYCNIEPSRILLFERLITNNHKIFFLPPPVMVYCSQIDLIPWASLQIWTISSWKLLLNVLYRKKKILVFLVFKIICDEINVHTSKEAIPETFSQRMRPNPLHTGARCDMKRLRIGLCRAENSFVSFSVAQRLTYTSFSRDIFTAVYSK